MADSYLSIPSGDYSIFVKRIRLVKWWTPAFFITLLLAVAFFEYLFVWSDFAVVITSILEFILAVYIIFSVVGHTYGLPGFMSEDGFKVSTSYPLLAARKFPCRYDDQSHTTLKNILNNLDKKIQIMSEHDDDEVKILAKELIAFSPEIKNN